MSRGTEYEPNDKDKGLVIKLGLSGLQQQKIADTIGVSLNTLKKYYKDDLENTSARANATVAASLYDMATKGKNVAAAIFWAKTRMGWRERDLAENDLAKVYQVSFTRAPDRPSSKKKVGT